MRSALRCEPSEVDGGLLGLIDYHEAVLKKRCLADRESDFRASKLGLVVDLVRVIAIPERLRAELTSALVEAWRLKVPEVTEEQRVKEIEGLLRGIEGIRKDIAWYIDHSEISGQAHLDLALRFVMMLQPSDLRPEAVSKVNGLIREAVISLGKPSRRRPKAYAT